MGLGSLIRDALSLEDSSIRSSSVYEAWREKIMDKYIQGGDEVPIDPECI